MVGQYTSYDWLPLVPFSMVWKTPDLKNDQENKPILIATRLWTWVLNCFYHLLPTWILISLLFEDMHSHDSSHSTQTSNDFLLRYYNNLSDLARVNWCKKIMLTQTRFFNILIFLEVNEYVFNTSVLV